jgi:hypothetical protein
MNGLSFGVKQFRITCAGKVVANAEFPVFKFIDCCTFHLFFPFQQIRPSVFCTQQALFMPPLFNLCMIAA